MKIHLIFFFSIVATNQAQTLESSWPVEPDEYKQIVIETIQSEISKSKKEVQEPKLMGTAQSLDNSPQLSKGELKVQELLKKQREKLKKKQEQPQKGWKNSKIDSHKGWLKKKKTSQQNWIKRKTEILNKWKKDKKEFKKQIPAIKRNLIPSRILEEDEHTSPETDPLFGSLKNNRSSQSNLLKTIDQTFHLPLRHQGERATCAAFSAIRLLEIEILKKEGKVSNLSEEYFFYLSRPDCHQKKCSRDGSWSRLGFKALTDTDRKIFLPSEKQCPYQYKNSGPNIFNLPLNKDCIKGTRKITKYSQLGTTENPIEVIKKGNALVMAFNISDDFIQNNGVLLKENLTTQKEQFAHTVLLVGIIPLPKGLHEKAGNYCFLAVNSWGSGWGIGGYACLGEKWMRKNKVINKPLYASL